MLFISPTEGKLNFEQTYCSIIGFVKSLPECNYQLIIGSDSQPSDRIILVTTIIIYREGKGARFYYIKDELNPQLTFQQRIYYETGRSLELASKLKDRILEEDFICDLDIEVHLDVGRRGKTKQLINEVVGMVVGSGYKAKIKPFAYGASNVADRYTK
ncbi:hypothetical protein U472_15770 [Orenia metallireducens]|jgi:hypothetical protein|uniref:Uncharacterized protein n=1 Tax=Orenia metallireducens TaxID=1413210 RepID=A0A1C0A6L6_9FIRM|nr:ribonuclease H-like YkuK family protein [Orenia metallireducens]OCL25777.1 hypothetical protein U472_15770 [Orenia metallireducens]